MLLAEPETLGPTCSCRLLLVFKPCLWLSESLSGFIHLGHPADGSRVKKLPFTAEIEKQSSDGQKIAHLQFNQGLQPVPLPIAVKSKAA